MSILKTLVLATAATGFLASQAFAAVVKNNDRRAYSVIVSGPMVPADLDTAYFEGQFNIAAGKSMELPCGQECTYRLAGSTASVKALGNSQAVIKGGKIQVLK